MGEDLVRKLIAEFIGTFILVFAGTAAFLSSGNYVFGFGFALIAIVYAIGHISGAHVNPAVTLALAVTGKFPMLEVPYYWGSQLLGALVASLIVRGIFGNDGNLAATAVAEGYSAVDGFLIELILTALLVFVIMAVATDKRSSPAVSGLAIGGTLLLTQVVGGEISGASVNPFRSLAPSVVSGSFTDIWIYLTAPFIGALLGAIGYEVIRGEGGLDLSAARTAVNDLPRPERSPRRDGGRRTDRGQRPADRGQRGNPRQQRPAPRQQFDDTPVEHLGEYGEGRTGERLRQADDVPSEHLSERAQRPQRQRQPRPQGPGEAQGQRQNPQNPQRRRPAPPQE